MQNQICLAHLLVDISPC